MTRKKLLAFSGLGVLLLAAVFVAALAPQKPENTFPLGKKTIEAAFEEQGLQWNVNEPFSLRDGGFGYMAYNENEKIIATIVSYAAGNQRALNLQPSTPSPYPPEMKETLSEPFKEDAWPDMFDLACHLYGGSSDSAEVYQWFIGTMQEESYEPKDRTILLDKKMDGIHYLIRLFPSKEEEGHFTLSSIQLLNDPAYRAYLASQKT